MCKLNLTLTKTETYNLKPYGHFIIKWNPSEALKRKRHVIPYSQISFNSESGMPCTKSDYKLIISFMKKHKTDVLTDGGHYYTTMGNNLVEIKNDRFKHYQYYINVNNYEDDIDSWESYIR